jgi:hypothetical protein
MEYKQVATLAGSLSVVIPAANNSNMFSTGYLNPRIVGFP